MKTRPPESSSQRPLPPPPAPTARDANPWPMSTPSAGTRHEPRHPRAPGWPPPTRTNPAGEPRAGRRLPWVPLLILFFIAGTGVQLAIRALWAGDVAAAIVALAIVAMVALLALRRLRRRN